MRLVADAPIAQGVLYHLIGSVAAQVPACHLGGHREHVTGVIHLGIIGFDGGKNRESKITVIGFGDPVEFYSNWVTRRTLPVASVT